MSLHYTRDGYTFQTDGDSITIEPGPAPITLRRDELAELGLQPRDDYRIPLTGKAGVSYVTDRILAALHQAIERCGPEEAWMALDLKRVMVMIHGLDEDIAQEILDQEDL